ncbi:MAG TPA: polysaccharide deacetylase family protein [Terriglobales bacterium]|nr:polysaccharide deacetylase family protein [Terriglobales bacterium]
MKTDGILFLMYHEIEALGRLVSNTDPGYVRYVVNEAEFQRHLELMRTAGLRGVTVTEALAGLPDHSHTSVALTFDDGCETDHAVAAPMLRNMGFNATLFIVAGFVGMRHFLTRSQLRELHEAGFEIGSHSMNHRHLTDLSDEELTRELRESKDALEQIIGAAVLNMSCPNGRWNARVARFAKDIGYQTVSTSRIARNFQDTDRFNLARLPIMRNLPGKELGRLFAGASLTGYQRKAAILKFAKHALGNTLYDRLRSMMLDRAG